MLEIIVSTIFIATVLNIFLKRFNIPTIIGYIITGTIISYIFGIQDAVHSKELSSLAEFGIVFLMFTIGLEFSINHLKKMKKNVFIHGGFQFIITSIVFFLIATYVFVIEIKSAIIIGTALSLSSTAIILKLLNDTDDIKKEYGHKSLGILLFQDLAVIPIFLMITLFSQTDQTIGYLLGKTIITAIILLSLLYVTGKYLLDPFLNKVNLTKSNEIFIGSILLIIMGFSYLSFILGFSYSLGAFIAGIMIAETHYRHQVEADLIPFRNILLGIFFITVGMQIDFGVIITNTNLIFTLLFILISIKALIIFIILRFSTTKRVALKSALTLSQFGEFGLVIFELAYVNNLVTHDQNQILVAVIILSMLLTPFIFKNIGNVIEYFIPKKIKDNIGEQDDMDIKNNIVIVGYGRLGKTVAKLLEKNKLAYTAIESNINIVKESQKNGKSVIFGSCTKVSLLESIKIHRASTIIISIGNSKKLRLVCESIRKVAPHVKTIIKVDKFEEKEMLQDLGISHIIVETEKTALAMFEKV